MKLYLIVWAMFVITTLILRFYDVILWIEFWFGMSTFAVVFLFIWYVSRDERKRRN